MKKLYEIDLTDPQGDQGPDIYFTSMTTREVDELHEFLTRQDVFHIITAITDSPGYHPFNELRSQWEEQYGSGKDWSPRGD